jgi:hypothetical protein
MARAHFTSTGPVFLFVSFFFALHGPVQLELYVGLPMGLNPPLIRPIFVGPIADSLGDNLVVLHTSSNVGHSTKSRHRIAVAIITQGVPSAGSPHTVKEERDSNEINGGEKPH